ncbi:MAG: PAS domain S-box protein [Gemmatimonadaceae bacterium]|nr:PAS domain S-box protein [Gemmatimonadaceae bacterium]
MTVTADIDDGLVRASEARLRAIYERAAVGIAIVDTDGVIQDTNPAFQQLLGYTASELRGRPSRELSPPEDAVATLQPVRDILAGRIQSDTVEKRYVRKDGSIRTVLLTVSALHDGARVTGVVGMAQDITEQRTIEHQLRHSQKMDALGRLAGSIAHDFNNLLSIITGSVDLLLDELVPGSPSYDDGEQIRGASERAAALTRQLLAFSRRQVVRPIEVDVVGAIRNLERLLNRTLGALITLGVELPDSASYVLVDAGQLDQVIVNLAVNARDAMPHGGTLSVRVWSEAGIDPGSDETRVRIDVSDTGVGMDEAILPHVFEPFFTTKEVGKGTGLGLSTVHGIIEQAGGTVGLRSAPGAGTTVSISFPAAPEPRIPLTSDRDSPQRHRGAAILLVEDDPLVRRVTRRGLEAGELVVTEAEDGEAALDFWSRSFAHGEATGFDAIVSDIVMPKMNGIEMARRIRLMHQTIPILFISGNTDDDPLQIMDGDDAVAFLQKPFAMASLLRQLAVLGV